MKKHFKVTWSSGGTLKTDLCLGCNVLQCWTEHVYTPEGKEHLQGQWCHLLVMQQKMQPEAVLEDINVNISLY